MTETPRAHERSPVGGAELSDGRPLRDGDDGLFRPTNKGKYRPLPREEKERRDLQEKIEQEEEISRQLERLLSADDAGSFPLPPPLLCFLRWTLLAAASILGLLLVGQGAAAVGSIRALPTPFDWIAGAAAAAFALVLAALIVRLGWALWRLRRSPAVHLASIRSLSERRQWQRLATHHAGRARQELRRHLQEYQHDLNVLNQDERTRLDAARRDLLAEPQTLSAAEWLEAFNGRFQSILDAAARRRVRAYAVKVFIGTGVSRFPLLDQAIVLYACMALLRELLALYGLRPGAVQAALLLARSVVATYLSGVLQDVADDAADAASTAADGLAEDASLQDVAAAVGSWAGVAASAAPLVGRAAEGAVNGALVWRLGVRAIRQIQPVRPTKRVRAAPPRSAPLRR